MTDENLFKDTQTQEQPAAPVITIPEEVADLVGEGKKYKDVASALKALKAAQEHISTLESENSKFRTSNDFTAEAKAIADRELETLKEEFRTMLKATSEKRDNATPNVKDPNTQDRMSAQQTLDANVDIDSIVERALNQRAIAQQADVNKKDVIDTLMQKYGKEASSTFYSVGSAWGYTSEQMNKLAETNPKAVFKMFDIQEGARHSNTHAKGFNKVEVPVRQVNWNNDKDVMAYMEEKRKALIARSNNA
jgi:hypothetical protein